MDWSWPTLLTYVFSFVCGFVFAFILSRVIVQKARDETISTFNAVLTHACDLAASKNWLELQIFLHEACSDQDIEALRNAINTSVRTPRKEVSK